MVRLDNLKALKLTASDLSEKVGGRYTYWRDLLAGKKSFGEKIARKIEEKLELRRGQLDDSHNGDDSSWPFELFTRQDWLLLDEKTRQEFENSIAGAIQRARLRKRHTLMTQRSNVHVLSSSKSVTSVKAPSTAMGIDICEVIVLRPRL